MTPTASKPVGPATRTKRSAVQAIVGFCVGLPLALALVPIPDKYNGAVATVVGIAAALAFLIPFVQNYAEGKGVIKTMFAGKNPEE